MGGRGSGRWTVTAPYDLVRLECERLSYRWWPTAARPFDVFFFGVRGPAQNSNRFDDTVGCAYTGSAGQPVCELWAATTDPGVVEPGHAVHPGGVATVIPGQLRAIWERGLHHSVYPCLTPTPHAVIPVWRGGDRSRIWRDAVGIQLHHAGAASVLVGDWSEGCQVLQRAADLDRALWLYDEQVRRGLGRGVSYTLFDVVASPSLRPLLGS